MQEIVVNEKGGQQSKTEYGFHLIDAGRHPRACARSFSTEHRGTPSRDNWRKIPSEEHFNHMMIPLLCMVEGRHAGQPSGPFHV